jgi:hypothetical protein
MLIIGCDFHTRYQQIAMLDEATRELVERRLEHENGEAHTFYRNLAKPVRVGIEATGPMHWFERLLAELGHELWIGDSAKKMEAARVARLLFTSPWHRDPTRRDHPRSDGRERTPTAFQRPHNSRALHQRRA